ncbi:hypothetical protein AB0H73_38010 [Streptomyces olivoreticuli]
MLDMKTITADGRYRVSTVEFPEHTPWGELFETMVFDTEIDDEVDSRRYATREEAVHGHEAMTQEVTLIEDALRL